MGLILLFLGLLGSFFGVLGNKFECGFKIQSFGDHKILFSFESKEDVDRILEGEPSSFDKHLVVMS